MCAPTCRSGLSHEFPVHMVIGHSAAKRSKEVEKVVEAGQVSALRQGRGATGPQAGPWEVDTEQASEQI